MLQNSFQLYLKFPDQKLYIINYISSIIRKTMPNLSRLGVCVQNIIKNINDGSINYSIHQNSDKILFKEDLFGCKNNYYADIDRNMLMTKIKMLQIVEKLKYQNQQQILSIQQKNIVKELQQSLSILNKQKDYLLNEGILNCYLQLSDIRTRSTKKDINSIVSSFICNIIQATSNLLKCYFIYHEYRNIKQNQSKPTNKSVFSLRNLNQSKNIQLKEYQLNQFDFRLMKQIQQSLASKSINELISNYMEKEIVQIKQKEQICRICSNKIRLQNIERHVKLCQKKSDLKQNLQNKNGRIAQLFSKMKVLLQQINQKSLKTQKDETLKIVITALLYNDKSKRQRGALRRSQSMTESYTQRLKSRWEIVLQEYETAYGKHQILNEIYKLQKEKVLIEKNILSLQISALSSENNQSDQYKIQSSKNGSNYTHSLRSMEFADIAISIGKTSQQKLPDLCQIKQILLEQKDEFKQNFVLSQKLEKQDNNIKQIQIQCQRKVRKSQSKTNLRRIFSEQIQTEDKIHRHYVSLQQIPQIQEQEGKISLKSFQILKILGQGAYGKVYMVRRKQTQDIYALKIITLSQDCTEKQLQTIGNEHQIFKKIAGDHLVKAPFSFSEKASHMFVLQFMPGGDLRKLLSDQVYFQQQDAKFYLAEIILAIEHLHNFKIIHRDLKPENLVLDQDGHLKLTDFGLSELKMQERLHQSRKLKQAVSQIKRTQKRRHAFRCCTKEPNLIGTPDYIAPQIINYVSTTNMTIDWWSLGVMAYELIIGTRPFCGDTIEEVVQNIQNFNIQWPEIGDGQGMISQKAKNLIQKLLNKDFINRLGANGADQIKGHPFFQGINWQRIKSSNPPFKPSMQKVKVDINAPEDKKLRSQIQKIIDKHYKLNKSKLKLDKFVRFDLLGSQTMENVEKIYNQQATRLQRLKTLKSFNDNNLKQSQESYVKEF